MKFFMTVALLSMFVSGFAFAAESKTKCASMQGDERGNPKAEINSQSQPAKKVRAGAISG